MLSFLAIFTNTDGAAFPDTAAIDASGGAATDGTEFIAAMINDSMWGWQQALLNYVGLAPNGITEQDGQSQIIEAMRSFSIPGIGIDAFWGDDPATLGIRAIMLTGQGVLRANYAELDAYVYVGDGNNAAVAAAGGAFYHADDAAGVTPNVAGDYLIMPDGRGRVMRGLDLTGSVDPDGVGAYIGEEQEDGGQQITGTISHGATAGFFTGAGISGAFSDGLATTDRPGGTVTAAGVEVDFDSANSPGSKQNLDQFRAKSILSDKAITY